MVDMFKQFRTKAGNFLLGKGWGIDFSDSALIGSDAVSIDPITAELLFSTNYQTLSRKGYIENVVSNRCIRDTARAVKEIPFEIEVNGNPVTDSSDRLSRAFIKLIADPNANYNWAFMVESAISHRFLKGRAYIHPTLSESTGEPLDIEFFRPDRVSITQDMMEEIGLYRYSKGTRTEFFRRDDEGRFDLIDWRSFHPTSDVDGLSNVTPTALSIDGHTEGSKWNKQHLENGARNTGIFTVDAQGDQTGFLDEEQVDKLKEKLNRNNGKRYDTMVLNAPGTYQQMNLTPQEMDFIDSIKAKAIDICTGLDYPPYLLGLDGATFNNQAEAKLALYEQSAIPKAQEFYSLLSDFYTRKLNTKIEFKLKLKEVVALAPRFKEMHEGIRADWDSDLIKRDEAREAVGYDELGGVDGDLFKSDTAAPAINLNPPT